jgi:hypothetical protein
LEKENKRDVGEEAREVRERTAWAVDKERTTTLGTRVTSTMVFSRSSRASCEDEDNQEKNMKV